MNRRQPIAARTLLVLMVVISLTAAVAEAQTKVNPGFNLFTAEQDVEIGQQSSAEAERQFPLLRDAAVNDYVNRIGRRLAPNAGGPSFPYQFKVVNASDINAFALPGGPIYVNRGIIENARNEGEVAGVIAHEIAHVALRHGTHQASKAYAAQAGLSILGGLLGGRVGNNTANILNAIGGIGLNAVFLKFSRELETQADIRGAQILAASGYTPADMVSFFLTLEKVDKSRKTTWMSDHPAPPDRISRIEREAKTLQVSDRPTTNVAELQRVQSGLKRLGNAPTTAEIARGGTTTTTAGNSGGSTGRSTGRATGVPQIDPPSSSMRTYTSRSGAYRVSYPANWGVYEEGTTGVTLAPQGGIGTVSGRAEVVYGAMVNHYDPFGAAQTPTRRFRRAPDGVYSGTVTLEAATNDLVAQIRQGAAHLQPISNSTQRFRLDGGNALAVSLRGVNPNTRINERVTVVTRQLSDQHLVYLLFVTPEADARSYGPVLQAMVNSLQVDDSKGH